MISRLDRLQGRDIYENTALAKLNEVIDAVNELQTTISKMEKVEPAENVQPVAESRPENVRLPYMQNKRLRKALGVAQSALVKLATDAYDMDEHIYIDKILNQIERITKGGDNEK